MRDTVRSHRVATLAWIFAGGAVMYGMAAALAHEMAVYPGGAAALGASVEAAAEALRAMRWPAERLDTLGGYLWYHNVTLYTYALALYGVVQGARDIRGAEERGLLEEVLATGHPRAAVVRDRTAGFALVAAAIGLGLGLFVAAAMAAGGEPDFGGSLIAMGTAGLVGLVCYCLGLLAGQVLGSSRSAAGAGAALLTVLYVATNLGETLGAFEVLTVFSPFRYANESRALVPGYGLDPVATAILVLFGVALASLAAWAYTVRDCGSPLWRRRSAGQPAGPVVGAAVDVPHRLLGAVWTAQLRRGLPGLAAWTLGAAMLTAMMGLLQPVVMDVWDNFDFMAAMTAGAGSMEEAYWSFTGEVMLPMIAAYVITAASGWIADLAGGRVEMTLSCPVSWAVLVRDRLIAVTVGVLLINSGALASLVACGAAVGAPIDPAGGLRLLVVGTLFGAAFAAVAAVLVAVVRRPVAITVLAVIVVASYLIGYLVPAFGWPEWLNRLSIFWAFGHPYLQWPDAAQLAVLLILAIGGGTAAALLAERTPKVA